jgi:hypothetical protein
MSTLLERENIQRVLRLFAKKSLRLFAKKKIRNRDKFAHKTSQKLHDKCYPGTTPHTTNSTTPHKSYSVYHRDITPQPFENRGDEGVERMGGGEGWKAWHKP